MKFSCVALFLLAFVSQPDVIFCQNYQDICTPGITFYRNKDNSFMAFRMDSAVPSGTNDTVFISYRAIRDVSGSCLDTTNGSILGRRICKTQTGWFYFFNRYGDTIKINSQASVNQDWKFCTLPGNGFIEAKVTSIASDSVFGTTDNVKFITLQAKDAGGNNISHILNQKVIKLSQHYGLSGMLDVFSIPDDTVMFNLAGKSIPAIGTQNLTWQEIYNFNVGDEFHYSGWRSATSAWKKILRVLTRTNYGNDSVSYTLERCQQTFMAEYPFYSSDFDTIRATYAFAENPQNKWISNLPGEFIPGYAYAADNYWFSTNSFQNRRLKGVTWAGSLYTWEYYGGDTCWRPANGYNGIVSSDNFAEGLGRTRTYWYQAEIPSYWETYENLVYYKKGDETWGTPVANDCSVLVGERGLTGSSVPGLKIYPNPAETGVTISIDGQDVDGVYSFTLDNSCGKRVAEGKLSLNPLFLAREGRPSGIYLLSVYGSDGAVVGRTKLMYR